MSESRAETQPEHSGDGASRAAGSERAAPLLLLVDDDAQVRTMFARLAPRLGFAIVTAADGETAIEEFRRRPGDFAAVILDLSLPRISGLGTHLALRALRPDIPVVVSSGSAEDAAAAEISAAGRSVILQKPFEFARLEEALATFDILPGR